MNEGEAADYIGKPPKTLRNWRYLGTGPAFVKCGSTVGYLPEDLDAYINANRHEPIR